MTSLWQQAKCHTVFCVDVQLIIRTMLCSMHLGVVHVELGILHFKNKKVFYGTKKFAIVTYLIELFHSASNKTKEKV